MGLSTARSFAEVSALPGNPEDCTDLGLSPASLHDLRRIDERQQLYNAWQPLGLAYDEKASLAFHIPAKNKPRGVVGFLSGCASSPTFFARSIHHFRQQGYSVIAMPQIGKSYDGDYIQTNQQLTDWFLMDKRSPLHSFYGTSLPRYLITHSAAGLHSNVTFLDPENAERGREAFAHVFHAAPFLDTVFSSLPAPFESGVSRRSRIARHSMSVLYGQYARLYADAAIGTTRIDKVFLSWKGAESTIKILDEDTESPTHGNALDLRQVGREATSRFAESVMEGGAHPIQRIPQTWIISPGDTAACPVVARAFAEAVGADIYECSQKTEHNPFHEDRSAVLKQIFSKIAETAERPRFELLSSATEDPDAIEITDLPEQQAETATVGGP